MARKKSQNQFHPNDIDKLCGWVPKPKEVELFLNQLMHPIFGVAAPHLTDSGKGKDVFLWDAEKSLTGTVRLPHKQTIGDCCFSSGTLVTMADGSEKAIEDVQIGDMVVTGKGNIRPVTHLFKTPYSGELVTIKVHGYSETLTATPDHKLTYFPNMPYPFKGKIDDYTYSTQWEQIGNLSINDRVLIPFGTYQTIENQTLDFLNYFPDGFAVGLDKFSYNGNCRVFKRFISVNKDFAWLIGIYLAEGGVSYRNGDIPTGVTFYLNRKEVLFGKQISNIFRQLFGIPCTISTPPSRPNVLLVHCSSKALGYFFKNYIKGNVYKKRIPLEIFRSNDECKLACLRGWFDGDGNFRLRQGKNENYNFMLRGVSCCLNLRRDMYRLCLSLKLKATLTTRKKEYYQNSQAGDVNLSGESALTIYPERREEIVQKIKIYVNQVSSTAFGLAQPIKSINRTNVENIYVYCLTVDEDHSFIANGFHVKNCSHGFGGAIDTLRFVRMAWQGQEGVEDFVESATEVLYAGSRVEIGKGECGTQDGSVGAWLAEWILKYGVVPRGKYGNIDLTTYSGERAKQWGMPRAGCPDELEPVAKQYPIRTCSLITGGYEEARDAIAGGKYPVACCSNQGFTLSRDKNGFCSPKGTWNHCIFFRGVSDNPKRPGLVYQQSWGVGVPDGPLHVTLPHGLEVDLPEGAFFVDYDICERMLKQNDSYVISDMVGYPARDFDFRTY